MHIRVSAFQQQKQQQMEQFFFSLFLNAFCRVICCENDVRDNKMNDSERLEKRKRWLHFATQNEHA